MTLTSKNDDDEEIAQQQQRREASSSPPTDGTINSLLTTESSSPYTTSTRVKSPSCDLTISSKEIASPSARNNSEDDNRNSFTKGNKISNNCVQQDYRPSSPKYIPPLSSSYDESAGDGVISSEDQEKYVYGDAVPDSEKSHPNNQGGPKYIPSSSFSRDESVGGDAVSSEDQEKYGYGDAVPDSEKMHLNHRGGFNSRRRTGRRESSGWKQQETSEGTDAFDAAAQEMYGYGDAFPDSDVDSATQYYGYGDGSSRRGQMMAQPRRSSMKHNASSSRGRRRASIQFGGGNEIEVFSYQEGRTIKRRTSITFNEKTDIRCVAPVKDLADDPESLWVQVEEMESIKQKALLIADHAEQGRQGKYCVRGLERYIGSAKDVASERRFEAWDSVLDEQLLQQSSGEYDDEYIANVYRYATIDTQREANERALKDAKDIELYLKNTRKACRRMSM